MKIEYKTLSVKYSAELAVLEAKCFGDPWTEKMFIDSLSSKYTQAIGAFVEDKLVGYIMWIFAGDAFEILNVATDPLMRRCGIAKRMITLLAGYARHLQSRAEPNAKAGNDAHHKETDYYRLGNIDRTQQRHIGNRIKDSGATDGYIHLIHLLLRRRIFRCCRRFFHLPVIDRDSGKQQRNRCRHHM